MSISSNASVVLPTGEVVLGICPGGNNDYTGSWPQARADLETWLNTGGVTGHRFKMLHGIVGNSWNSSSYYNSRTMWSGLPSDVQPLISIPSMFPQYDPGTSTPATYDKALAGNYDSLYNTVFGQIAADYPYASLRVGQEVDGGWFWWGIGTVSGNPAVTNGGTAVKVAQLHTKLSRMARAAGWKGTWEVNCGNSTVAGSPMNISQIIDLMSAADWDIAGCDSYGGGNAGSTTDFQSSWTNVQYPMIANAMAMATKYNKAWGMSEWGCYSIVDGTTQYGCGDDPYYLQQVRALAIDPTRPRCAYLSLFFGNDWNSSTSMHRLDAMAKPASTTSGPWSDRPEFPKAIAELKGANWTPSGLTTSGPTGGGTYLFPEVSRKRHTTLIFR